MVTISNINFSDTLEVLFTLRQSRGCRTIQDTYKILENTDIDTVLEVLLASYNAAHHGKEVTLDTFVSILAENKVGFVKLTDVYSKVVEALMFNGMTPEEIEERKNLLMSLVKKHPGMTS